MAGQVIDFTHGVLRLHRLRGTKLREPLASDCRNNAVLDATGKHVRPLENRLVRHPDCRGCERDRAPQHLNGFGSGHAPSNHSFASGATIVLHDQGIVSTMVEPLEYKDRLKLAMAHARISEKDLADALDFTMPGIKKALKGGDKGTSAMTAENNAKVAAICGVNPDWLATGEGKMEREDAWPFEMVDRERFDRLSPKQQAFIEGALANALAECEQQGELAKTKNR